LAGGPSSSFVLQEARASVGAAIGFDSATDFFDRAVFFLGLELRGVIKEWLPAAVRPCYEWGFFFLTMPF